MADMPNDSRCPVCDQIVSGPPGSSAPTHTEPGSNNKRCPGSGQSTVPR